MTTINLFFVEINNYWFVQIKYRYLLLNILNRKSGIISRGVPVSVIYIIHNAKYFSWIRFFLKLRSYLFNL